VTELAGAIRTIQRTKAGNSALVVLGLAALVVAGFLVLQIGSWAFSQGSQAVTNLSQRQPSLATNLGATGVQTPQSRITTQYGMDCSNIRGRMVERLGHKNGCSGGNLAGYASPPRKYAPRTVPNPTQIPRPGSKVPTVNSVNVIPQKPVIDFVEIDDTVEIYESIEADEATSTLDVEVVEQGEVEYVPEIQAEEVDEPVPEEIDY